MSIDPLHMDPSVEEEEAILIAEYESRKANWRQVKNARELSRSDCVTIHGQDGKPDTDEVEDRPQALTDTTSVKRVRVDPLPTFCAPLGMIPMPVPSSEKSIDLTCDDESSIDEVDIRVESPVHFGYEPPLGFPMVSPMPSAILKFSYVMSHKMEVGPTIGFLRIFCGRYKHIRTGQLYRQDIPFDIIEKQIKSEWHKIEAMLKAGDFIMACWKSIQYCGFDK